MNYTSHIIGGLATGVTAVYLGNKWSMDPHALIVIGGTTLGSLLPDIDHPKSFLGNKIPILPRLLYRYVGHRTFTHSLFFATIIALLFYGYNESLGVGLFLGILSHIFLDMLTPQGVAYLYPFIKRRIRWR